MWDNDIPHRAPPFRREHPTKEPAIAIGLEAGRPPAPPLSFVDLGGDADRPVSLVGIGPSASFGRADVPLVELFTAEEQRERTSQAYFRSAVGARLRYTGHQVSGGPEGDRVTVAQRDDRTGLAVRTTLTRPHGTRAVRLQSEIENTGSSPVLLTAVSTATFGFGRSEADLDGFTLAYARSEWLAENRWRTEPVRDLLPGVDLAFHGQDGRGHFGFGSHGAWSTGEHLAAGVLADAATGEALAWQLETGTAWHCDLAQAGSGGIVSLLGPADLEHHFAHELEPGGRFTTVPAAIAVADGGPDAAIAELTRYRRRSRPVREADEALPIVYNDFMNTLMGQPSTEALKPLVDAAAEAGAECFCIDAGWFADPAIGDWWATVGEWREAPGRFSGGLKAIVDHIHARGMRSGLWLEPEVVGARSPMAEALPEEAFFHRFGRRVQEHERYHLDFRHPAARAHLDAAVDCLVADYGIGYLKLDYNINPGPGTEWRAAAAGDGLLAHARAFRDWLVEVQGRHPQLLVENCASGAMRADHSLVAVTHLQSTSDQQDFRRYPPVAAAAPATIPPERCGNWAYPHADMTDEESAFTLATGLSGRLYLSGFLHELRPGQTALVHEAVEVHKGLRERLPRAVPFWPLGLPEWDAPVVCLGLDTGDGRALLVVWDRASEPSHIAVPGLHGTAAQVFPKRLEPWAVEAGAGGLELRTVAGHSARVFEVVIG
ncbi:glycoside hydrolase family 36 protein [Glycomyces arizonensis]|uniref:glycoside hydrolase family 36 protein n=1 Tax=Glycomyces arizonensis TaxID=256035 RepID=UPI0004116E32|nr:glycoside hydrolase family 36 protein [Glycomyces arizonensis]